MGSGRLSSTTRPGAAQEILDITERVTNTSDSTKRKHLVLGLYRCAVCGCRVMGAQRGYRCAGHVRRTGSHIDELVTEVIAGRLGQPEALAKHQTSGEASETSGISAAVAEQRGRILALHNWGCSWGLNPPVSRRQRVM